MGPSTDEDLAGQIETLTAALAEARHELADLQARVRNAQSLANMGDYDWHIASDTNSWSDQLYRIYGYEPGAFNASYERFLGMLHPDDRDRITALHQQAYAEGGAYQMVERIVRPDGEIRYLSSNGEVLTDAEGTPVRMRGTCIDITERVLAEQAREELAADLREAQVRRRQSLEINDNLVQGLTAAVLCLDCGDRAGASAHLHLVLNAARTMMNNLLTDPGMPLLPGGLTRTTAASLEDTPSGPAPRHRSVRVVVADDHTQLRELVRTQLEAAGHQVVGEARDGVEAVTKATELAPDVLVLDLAMPGMDGLQALTLIRDAAPHVRVIVVSGFDGSLMADRALEAGAYRYVEKGMAMNLAETVREVALSA